TIICLVAFTTMIGGAIILSRFMEDMLCFTAFGSGLMMRPGALFMRIMGPVFGRLFDYFGSRCPVISGLGLSSGTTCMFSVLESATTFTYIAVVNAVGMLGISMVMMPSTTAGLNQLSDRLVPHGTAMNNTMRQVAGAVGTALFVSVMTITMIPGEGAMGMIH